MDSCCMHLTRQAGLFCIVVAIPVFLASSKTILYSWNITDTRLQTICRLTHPAASFQNNIDSSNWMSNHFLYPAVFRCSPAIALWRTIVGRFIFNQCFSSPSFIPINQETLYLRWFSIILRISLPPNIDNLWLIYYPFFHHKVPAPSIPCTPVQSYPDRCPTDIHETIVWKRQWVLVSALGLCKFLTFIDNNSRSESSSWKSYCCLYSIIC